jgi:hypothetical protein
MTSAWSIKLMMRISPEHLGQTQWSLALNAYIHHLSLLNRDDTLSSLKPIQPLKQGNLSNT